ncbi:hypothetical protein [Moorena sp. SIO3A5]|nr:hypothetical protein [Moorena sp. SIO3A5]
MIKISELNFYLAIAPCPGYAIAYCIIYSFCRRQRYFFLLSSIV